MDTAKIIRLVAVLFAIAAAFFRIIPYTAEIMILLGLAMGFVGVAKDRQLVFLVTALTLNLVVDVLDPLPEIGPYLTAILGNLGTIVSAGAVAVMLTIFKERMTA